MKKKWICAILSALLALSLAGCGKAAGYGDTAPRPDDIERPETAAFVEYPARPAEKPVADPSKTPTVAEYTVRGGYTAADTAEGKTFSYDGIEDWSYIYARVRDYRPDYGNFILELSCAGAERIAVQAIYYEMYEKSYRPVTVYRGDLTDGAQKAVVELGGFKALDSTYSQLADESLQGQTVLGFCIFIDSNPKQNATVDRKGSVTVTSFEFLENGDERLDDKYVKPGIGSYQGDAGYEIAAAEGVYTIARAGGTAKWTRAYLNLANYSADFAQFTFRAELLGVKKLSVGITFDTQEHTDWQNYVILSDITVTDGTRDIEIDFSAAMPVSTQTWDYVPGYFVKNFPVTSIIIYLDTATEDAPDADASLTISDLAFVRTASDGTTVGKAWTANTPSVTVGEDVAPGGAGSVAYEWYTEWYYLTMPVSGYTQDAKKLTVTFEAASLSNIGIALFADGMEYVLHSSNSGVTEVKPPAEGTPVYGMVEKVSFDDKTNIYVYEFDLTGMDSGLAQKMITGLRFYLNDPTKANSFDGTKTVRFIGVTLE